MISFNFKLCQANEARIRSTARETLFLEKMEFSFKTFLFLTFHSSDGVFVLIPFCIAKTGIWQIREHELEWVEYPYRITSGIPTLSPLSANLTKWSNTLQQSNNFLSVFNDFVGLTFEWSKISSPPSILNPLQAAGHIFFWHFLP